MTFAWGGMAQAIAADNIVDNSTYGRVSPAFQGLKAALADGTRSIGVQVLGDSTGAAPTAWPYRLAEAIAADYPAWTIHHRIWLDATQEMNYPSVIQQGTAGLRYLDGSTGTTTRRLPAASSVHTPGVLDVRIKASMTDWTPGTAYPLMGRAFTEGTYGWYITVSGLGLPAFVWSSTGMAAQLISKNATAVLPFADAATGWLRCVFTPDNGAAGNDVQWYTSTDGIVWTQLGITVTTAGVTTLFDSSTIGYELGGVQSGRGNAGLKVYEVQIRNGLNGPNVVPCLPDLWPPFDANAVQVVGAPILTFVNGSYSGATIAYLGDATRLPKITPDYGQLVTILSDSHNEGTSMGTYWTGVYDTWRLAVEAQVPGAPVVVLTQNPETSGTSWYREHAKRRLDLIGYARQKGLGLIDTYRTLLDAGLPGIDMADAVHPNATGYDLWRDAIKAHIDAA